MNHISGHYHLKAPTRNIEVFNEPVIAYVELLMIANKMDVSRSLGIIPKPGVPLSTVAEPQSSFDPGRIALDLDTALSKTQENPLDPELLPRLPNINPLTNATENWDSPRIPPDKVATILPSHYFDHNRPTRPLRNPRTPFPFLSGPLWVSAHPITVSSELCSEGSAQANLASNPAVTNQEHPSPTPNQLKRPTVPYPIITGSKIPSSIPNEPKQATDAPPINKRTKKPSSTPRQSKKAKIPQPDNTSTQNPSLASRQPKKAKNAQPTSTSTKNPSTLNQAAAARHTDWGPIGPRINGVFGCVVQIEAIDLKGKSGTFIMTGWGVSIPTWNPQQTMSPFFHARLQVVPGSGTGGMEGVSGIAMFTVAMDTPGMACSGGLGNWRWMLAGF